jgi:hypothetical protein
MGLGIRDPLALIDDVEGDLRLLVFPGETHACDTATGLVTPSPAEERGAAAPDAVVDINVPTGAPTAMVQLNPGTYSVLVRGWGTDPVSMRDNVIIASGCARDVAIEAGSTQEIDIDLIQIFGEGVCGDGTLSPDEQCEPLPPPVCMSPGDCDSGTCMGPAGMMTCGPVCTDCRTQPILVSRPPDRMAGEVLPSVAWTPGSRVATVYDSNDDTREVKIMLLGESGQIITSPTALQVDGIVDTFAGVQTEPVVAIGGSRIAVAWSDFRSAATEGGDVYVRFVSTDRTPLGTSVLATASSAGAQVAPSIATRGDGSTLVVFQDGSSATTTGLSSRFFAAGSMTPSGDVEPVGAGASGATAPAVSALPDGFFVAFAAGGDVHFQRFGTSGAPADAMARPVLEDTAGTQDQPAVASLPDGTTIVAWRDSTGDSAGTAIRARVFRADGAAVGPPVVVNSTTAGDQVEPAAAAGGARFVVAFKSGTEIRATMLNADGMLALNREPDPSTGDFLVASGAVGEHSAAAGGPAAGALFIVVWKDTSMDAAGDIRGRLFPMP